MGNKHKFLGVVGLVILLLLTNPDKEKHKDFTSDLYMELAEVDSKDAGILNFLLGGLLEHAINSRMKLTNYYVFSVSYIKDSKVNRVKITGFGILGNIFPLTSIEGLNKFMYTNKVLTGAADQYPFPPKQKDYPRSQLTVNPKVLKWIGID